MNGVDETDLVVGVDTDLDTHTAAICDVRGRAVSQMQAPASTVGYRQLLAWARTAADGGQVVWAVEGTRHYGLGLARYLAAEGQQVAEIDCSRHIGKPRAGKSDPIDAVRAARELLARPRPAQMRADGDREALRLLMTGRTTPSSPPRPPAPPWPRSWSLPPHPCVNDSGLCPGNGGRKNAPHSHAPPAPTARPASCTRP